MHGSMTSPWSSEEDDKQLMALASLVHSLTKRILLDEAGIITPPEAVKQGRKSHQP